MTRNKYHGIKSAQTNMIALIIIYILFISRDMIVFFFFQAEDGIRDVAVTGVQTCALPISTLLEVRTYRFMGHSMSDPLHGVYRTKEEVEEQRKRDPISQLAGKLKEEGVLDEAGGEAPGAQVGAGDDEEVRFAPHGPDPHSAPLSTHRFGQLLRRSPTPP